MKALYIFLARRAAVAYIVFSTAALAFSEKGLYLALGAFAGVLAGIFKIAALEHILNKAIKENAHHSQGAKLIIKAFLMIMLSLVLLSGLMVINISLFAGACFGLLMVPLVIIINGITEALGVTCNNFE